MTAATPSPTVPILLAVHADTLLGRELLGDRWPAFFHALRDALRQDAAAELAGTDDLLLFQHHELAPAIASLLTRLDQGKAEYGWKSGSGPAPLHCILHFGPATDDLPQPLRDPASQLWTLLEHETIHITTPLKEQWAALATAESVADHHLGDEEAGFWPVRFSARQAVVREPLFPGRHLTRTPNQKICFYCGMSGHDPANCPSKLLTMQAQGLPLVGYQPLPRLNDLFQQALAQQDRLLAVLSPGIATSQLRRDPLLQVYVAFFDLCRVYQPRFLWNIAFSAHSRWQDLGRAETISVDSHNFYLGLDCLRVGQYPQAEDLFVDESRRPRGKQFHATIARAFLSLELGRDHDMGHYLESALRMTATDKDRIYISLLLSRFHALLDNNWKAEHALDNIFTIDRECPEALYAQVQLAVRNGLGERALNQLRALIVGQKELYLQALMDPELIPIEGPLEEMLAARLAAQEEEAQEQLAKAGAVVQELQGWLGDDDAEMRHLLGDFAGLGQQYEQRSYYDLIDVTEKGRILLRACYRVQEAKLDALKQRTEKTQQRLNGYHAFWNAYPYQAFFGEFLAILTAIKAVVGEARESAAKKMHGILYREILARLDQAEQQFEVLGHLTARMAWMRTLLDGGKLFLRRLLISELALLGLAAVLLPLFILLLGGPADSTVAALLRDPWFQRQAIQLITLLLAPLLALAQTLWAVMDS